MSKINYKLTYKSEYKVEIDLDPKDFVDCDTVDQLYSEVRRKVSPQNMCTFEEMLDENIDISDEFIEQWKKLVGFIPNNVMTKRLRDIVLSNKDAYIEVYSGVYLNHIKNNHSYNWDFDYRNYCNFNFDENARYKCWLIDTDHYDNFTTTLMYAEKI